MLLMLHQAAMCKGDEYKHSYIFLENANGANKTESCYGNYKAVVSDLLLVHTNKGIK